MTNSNIIVGLFTISISLVLLSNLLVVQSMPSSKSEAISIDNSDLKSRLNDFDGGILDDSSDDLDDYLSRKKTVAKLNLILELLSQYDDGELDDYERGVIGKYLSRPSNRLVQAKRNLKKIPLGFGK